MQYTFVEEFDPKHSIVLNGVEYCIGTRVFRWNEEQGFDGYTTKRVVAKTVNNKTGKESIRNV